jgi:hypothetical protein
LEKCGNVFGELVTEQKWVFAGNESFQPGSSLKQWLVTKILPVQMKEVERTEDQALRTPSEETR